MCVPQYHRSKTKSKVYFQIRLYYGDDDRPGAFTYVIKFETDQDQKKSGDESDDDDDDENKQIRYKSFTKKYSGFVHDYIKHAEAPGINSHNGFSDSEASSRMCERVAVHILQYLLELPHFGCGRGEQQTEPGPRASSITTRNTSLWDFVPIVGGVRDVMYATDDFKNGHVASGIFNLGIGVGGLALDFLSFGAASTVARAAVRGTTKVVARGVVKNVAKQGAKVVVKETSKQVAKGAAKVVYGVIARSIIAEVALNLDNLLEIAL